MQPARCSHSPYIVFISLIVCMKTKIVIMPAQDYECDTTIEISSSCDKYLTATYTGVIPRHLFNCLIPKASAAMGLGKAIVEIIVAIIALIVIIAVIVFLIKLIAGFFVGLIVLAIIVGVGFWVYGRLKSRK